MTVANRWLWLAGLVLLGWLIAQLQPILSPFLLGFLIAYLGDPLADWLEAKGLGRTWAVTLVFGVFTLFMLVALLVVLPLLGRQLVKLAEFLPQLLDWLQSQGLPWVQSQLGLADDFWQLDQLKKTLVNHLGDASGLMKNLLKAASSSGMAVMLMMANLVLVPVVSFYLLRDWDDVMARLRSLLPRRQEGVIVALAGECHEVIGAFLRGQLLVMLALGTVYALGLMLLGLDLGLLIGMLAGLASIVPYMGFAVGIVAALVATLFQFGVDPYMLLGVVAVFSVGQMLEGMLLTPLLVGDRIGLHPVAVIFAIMAGGQLFGFVGVLLALPVAAVIMVLLRHVHDLYKLSDLYGKPAEPAPPSQES
ncbi:AI-2E family transporter [Atopomonas sediminilitoris]|uniref:AI-2E family transporter n=1 Tax=Atopomonas sediminilitoris TaxID=2919919 RepID=UPI001F4E989D|nr:AI-2E family transporter [Atopomonas sediminilitoris]MCJ8169289.1 AI-2E family transporter [Atopomonas sediminilitoris]